MNISRAFLVTFALMSFGCAHKPAVVSHAGSGWYDYDRCESAGQYKFISQHTFAVLAHQDLQAVEWMIVGRKPVVIEFLNEDPKVTVTALPSYKKLGFSPEFVVYQHIDTQHPVHQIPEGMTTQYDFEEKKLLYGKQKRVAGFGPKYFERHGEVKSPRSTQSTVKGQKLSGEPSPGYRRYMMFRTMPIGEAGTTELIVEIPTFKLNGELVENQQLKFAMGKRYNTEPFDPMRCHGSEPRGLKYYFLKIFN